MGVGGVVTKHTLSHCLTVDVNTDGGQRRYIGRTECIVSTRVHFGDPVTTVQLVIEIDSNLQ